MFLIVGFVATAGLSSAGVAADEQKVPEPKPPGGSIMKMDKFYPGTTVKVGEFPGELVCLRTDDSFVPASAEECGNENRVFALAMKQEGAVHPLLPGSKVVLDRFREMLGSRVVVEGKYYSSTGLIMASAIDRAQPSELVDEPAVE